MAESAKIGYWLFKQEPACYSYADLEHDGGTEWDGVSNALALKHLRQVKAGDCVLFYHTGKERAVVGEMVVVGVGGGEPSAVKVAPVRRLTPVTLATIKGDSLLREWDLVRLPRLSVVPTSERQWKRILELSQEGSGPAVSK
jgi:predicted RNA-binding protein with PUA-like domain